MQALYNHTDAIHNTKAAEIIVPIVLDQLPSVRSVLDVGCGTGTWLTVFNSNNITDIIGIDGDYLDRSKLKIPRQKFIGFDLRKPFDLKRTFDLVLCLEVAEHLPKSSSQNLIDSLAHHSDRIVFSAAIPGQGGQNHINEQWPSYWEDKFKQHGYNKIDFIRPRIWSNQDIEVWYRQNIFLYTKKDSVDEVNTQVAEIHPDLWASKIKCIKTLQHEVNAFESGDAGVMRTYRGFKNAIVKKLLKYGR